MVILLLIQANRMENKYSNKIKILFYCDLTIILTPLWVLRLYIPGANEEILI